ncbi:MAG: 16S rRNA (guanine(527)-N(7))-methyltransferase RsmG [Coxiellaceae bacterium]|nr:16S rRNA (guanine(527)-N(7))-methyltransferase RsmG [Coxiellaceae bacterium]
MQNKILSSGISQLQLTMSNEAQEKLLAYLHLLQKWNHAYNLTAITDFDKMITYHLLDSLSIAPFILGNNIVDVGSGAGLPGIPLAIYFPEKQFTLMDSIGKKTRFIAQAVRELQLKNVQVVQTRAEEYQSKNAFDTMTARAVASIDDLVKISRELLQDNGKLLMMKADVSAEELEKYPLTCEKLSVPGIDGERCLIIL